MRVTLCVIAWSVSLAACTPSAPVDVRYAGKSVQLRYPAAWTLEPRMEGSALKLTHDGYLVMVTVYGTPSDTGCGGQVADAELDALAGQLAAHLGPGAKVEERRLGGARRIGTVDADVRGRAVVKDGADVVVVERAGWCGLRLFDARTGTPATEEQSTRTGELVILQQGSPSAIAAHQPALDALIASVHLVGAWRF